MNKTSNLIASDGFLKMENKDFLLNQKFELILHKRSCEKN